jgi:hypothetical protein
MGLSFNLGRLSPSLFTDSSLNVGIGAAPSGSYKLEVTGTAKVSSTVLVSGVSTLTGNVFLSNGSGNAVATLGGSPTANDGASLSLIPSNSAINWAIRVNWNLAGALEFCPSTAGGGSTFSSTPSFYLSSTGLATFSSFGSHSFSSAGTGYNKLTIRNTTAGAGNGAQLSIGTNADPDQFYVQSFATTFTTSGMNIAGGAVVNGEGPGGLSLAATQSNIGFYTNGAAAGNLRMFINTSGNIGVATSSPDQRITIQANGSNALIGFKDSAGTSQNFIGQGLAANDIIFGSSTNDLLFRTQGGNMLFSLSNIEFARFTAGGSLGLGVTSLSYKLQLSTDSAGKPNGGSWANSSDIRLKENIKTIDNAVDKITQLRGVTFDWKDETEQDNIKQSAGFIADEVMLAFPNWVRDVNASSNQKELINDDKVKSLSLPFEFDALLVQAIKELNERLNKAGL